MTTLSRRSLLVRQLMHLQAMLWKSHATRAKCAFQFPYPSDLITKSHQVVRARPAPVTYVCDTDEDTQDIVQKSPKSFVSNAPSSPSSMPMPMPVVNNNKNLPTNDEKNLQHQKLLLLQQAQTGATENAAKTNFGLPKGQFQFGQPKFMTYKAQDMKEMHKRMKVPMPELDSPSENRKELRKDEAAASAKPATPKISPVYQIHMERAAVLEEQRVKGKTKDSAIYRLCNVMNTMNTMNNISKLSSFNNINNNNTNNAKFKNAKQDSNKSMIKLKSLMQMSNNKKATSQGGE